MVKNLPWNTENMGLILSRGTKIPQATKKLTSCTTVRILCATIKTGHNQMNEQFLKSRINRFLYREEEKETAEDEMLGWYHRLSGYEFK